MLYRGCATDEEPCRPPSAATRQEATIIRPAEAAREGKVMGRRRDYDEGYEDARRDMVERETGSRRGGDGAFTAAVFIKYAAIVIVVIIIAYVVLRILRAIQAGF